MFRNVEITCIKSSVIKLILNQQLTEDITKFTYWDSQLRWDFSIALDYQNSIQRCGIQWHVLVSHSGTSDSLQPHGECSLQGSSVRGILQAGILGWLSFPSPEDLPDPGPHTLQADSLPSEPPGKPHLVAWLHQTKKIKNKKSRTVIAALHA